MVKSAFFEMRLLRISYLDAAGQLTTREIEPQFLYLNLPVWYLLAWDRWREAVRFFRIDRLRGVGKDRRRFPPARSAILPHRRRAGREAAVVADRRDPGCFSIGSMSGWGQK